MFVFIRDVIAEKVFQSGQRYMLGGLSLAVKIDESMFGIRVYELITEVNLLLGREKYV